MKKVLTVLAILVVLTSAIFAETHKITINARSTEVEPVFQMTIGNVTTNTNNSVFGTANNDSLIKVTPEEVYFNFEQGGTVGVSVKIQNPAKTKTNYSFAFSDGVFAVNKNGASKDAQENAYTVAPTITATAKSGVGFAALANSNEDKTANIDFNGTTCTAGTEIVTATFVYGADTTVDPGKYTANIQLDITTN